MPPQITCASAIHGKAEKHESRIFTQMLHCLNSTRCSISSTFLTHAAVWLPKSCNQYVQLGAVGGIVQEKGSRERCRSWTVLDAQCTSALSSGFPISHVNAEALERWGGKTKHHLISCFLSNTSGKNCRNWIMHVKIIASQMWDVFETQCICKSRPVSSRLVFCKLWIFPAPYSSLPAALWLPVPRRFTSITFFPISANPAMVLEAMWAP